MKRRVAVYPSTRPAMHDSYVAIVENSAAELADLSGADAMLWADPGRPDLFPSAIAAAPGVDWIHLPFAGVEPFVPYLDHQHTWTCAKGVYAEPVAEHAIGMALSGLRNLHAYARAKQWEGPVGINLLGASVTILGAGGITESLLRLLKPWRCHVTVVRRKPDPMPGADETIALDDLHTALATADVVILALALTDETTGLFDRGAFEAMKPSAWLVNVARGRHIVTDDLVHALEDGVIGGAALDVTEPEPLPDGHRLWDLENCLITPHIGNTPEMGLVLLKAQVAENVRRYCSGEDLLGLVDVSAGY